VLDVPPADFVPDDFDVPTELVCEGFRLTRLGPEHNIADHAAWTSSIEHIRATPGFAGEKWPVPMTLEANLDDLRRHRDDFERRRGFTYTVLDEHGDVIGCVYIYPSHQPTAGADVASWVCAARRPLDRPLWHAVSNWLESSWPFTDVRYAPRGDDGEP